MTVCFFYYLQIQIVGAGLCACPPGDDFRYIRYETGPESTLYFFTQTTSITRATTQGCPYFLITISPGQEVQVNANNSAFDSLDSQAWVDSKFIHAYREFRTGGIVSLDPDSLSHNGIEDKGIEN